MADSARRALDLLFAFTEQRPAATVRELAEELGIPLPSAHRYVALLRDLGLVEEGGRGRYRLTMRVAALGRAARRATPLVDRAEPGMRALCAELAETVLLTRLVRGWPVCLHRAEPGRPVRLSFEVGQYLPALRGAGIHLLLGDLPAGERAAYVRAALAAGERPPVRGEEGFLAAVERDAARGWATSNDEIDEGVWAAAAPVREAGRTVAALVVPAPAFRVDEERQAAIIDGVRKAADGIGRAL